MTHFNSGMLRRILIAILACLVHSISSAQVYQKNLTANSVKAGDHFYRFYPVSLVNVFDMNVTGGVEYAYSPNRSIFFDAGYIYASVFGGENNTLKWANGWLLRTGHRWYVGNPNNGLGYLDIETMFKSARYDGNDQWMDRGVVNGVPAYQQWMEVTDRKDVWRLGVSYGKRHEFSAGSAWMMEWCFGLGVRYRNYYPNIPPDASDPSEDFSLFQYGEHWVPDVQGTVRLVWKGSKKKRD
ncbi:MAG TPA: hypothetical protein VLC98_14010 [Phnomibacter sp.]|nr:hypothetical protein [Phnomibacter sp.]